MVKFPIAPNGIFRTIQGEGFLMGLPMIFIRLAGCSIGCPQCDTNYSVNQKMTVEEIKDKVSSFNYGAVSWVWLTGGEPTDHEVGPLVEMIHKCDLKIAMASAGTKKIKRGSLQNGVDFLSISPHSLERWEQKSGNQVNIVPGLNGLELSDMSDSLLEECSQGFSHKYVTPLEINGALVNLEKCIEWVQRHEGWRLGIQAHKHWNLP